MRFRSLFIFGALILFVMTSCSKLNDLQSQLDRQEKRIAALETECKQINQNIASLQTLVSLLQSKDHIVSILPVIEDEKTIGYTISFEKADPITIYNGKDGIAPLLGTKEDEGTLYWTLNGQWLLDKQGEKLPVDQVTPIIKVVDGQWYVSIDDGKTWDETSASASEKLFKEIKVGEEDVVFVLAGGTTITMPINTSERFNIPTGIVMMTSEISEMFRDDVAIMDIIVNPSNYPLKIDQLEFLSSHNIYTCCSGESGNLEKPGYDTTVTSTFEPVAIQAVDGVPGAYQVAFTAQGNGNYYDYAALYLVVKAKDSKGELKKVYSSNPCQVTVIPRLSEGLYIDAPSQSMFVPNNDGTVDLNVVKPYYIGVWSKYYVNIKGERCMYGREGVSINSVSPEISSTLYSDYFETTGFVAVEPDVKSEYWADVIKNVDSMNSVCLPDASITLTRDGALSETVTIPFNYKYFLHPSKVLKKELSYYGDELDKKDITYDYTEFRNKAGVLESKKSWFYTDGSREDAEECGFVPLSESDPRDPQFCFDINFSDYSPEPVTTSYKANALYKYSSMMYGQGKDGSYVKFPDEFPGSLIYMVIYHDYLITE